MLVPPILHVEQIDRAELNKLLEAWGHRMGPYTRPTYTFEAHHALFRHGRPIAVTAAGETVRETVGDTGIARSSCVELARLCSLSPFLCRPMLRLWRHIIFPAIADAHHRRSASSW
jgi:hypothetical protein